MERLTNEEVRVDESMDRYLGPRSVLEGMKPKLLDLVLNGPVLNSVSKAALRQIIRQLYSALAAYEDMGLDPESVEALKLSMMGKAISEITEFDGLPIDRLRELAEADKEGRLVELPCRVGDRLYEVTGRKTISVYKVRAIRVELFGLFIEWDIVEGFVWQSLSGINAGEIGKTAFLTREEAEKALEAMKNGN